MATDPRYLAQQYITGMPAITQAYQNDPRTKLMNSALALGSSGAPVAGGDYAWLDGLSRVGQGILGGILNKQQEKKYAAAGAQSMANVNAATNPATANPTTANPALQNAASALGGGGPPATGQDAAALQMAAGQAFPGGMPPQAAGNGPPSAMPPPPQGPQGSPPSGPVIGSNAPVPMAGGPQMDPMAMYRYGIRPIEGGTDPKTGAFRTSPKGAVGPGQIMPGTGPEAARLAGLTWNANKFSSDAQYNDALGQAYFAKQLETFGDPLKAAAAYNAGPARVGRALRREAATGQNWTNFIPAETRKYVKDFADKIGGVPQVQGAGSPQIPQMQMEAVPQGPAAPPAEQPAAPALPKEVQSERLDIARRLIATGDPSLFQLAQQYMDKGLGEQNDARTLASQQEFQRGQTGYSSALNNYNNAQEAARANGYQQVRDAQNRNFQRETGQFQAQNEANQNWRNQNFQAGQNALERENRLEVAGIKKFGNGDNTADQIEKFYSTGWGSQERAKVEEEVKNLDEAAGLMQSFKQLNANNPTGGVQGVLSDYTGINRFRPDYQTMDSNAKAAVFSKLGGLGRNISDNDRQYVDRANFGIHVSKETNDRVIDQQLAVINRRKDYLQNSIVARATGKTAQFDQNWDKYRKAVSIFTTDNSGKRVINPNAPTFEQWAANPDAYKAAPTTRKDKTANGQPRSGVIFGGKTYTYDVKTGKWSD